MVASLMIIHTAVGGVGGIAQCGWRVGKGGQRLAPSLFRGAIRGGRATRQRRLLSTLFSLKASPNAHEWSLWPSSAAEGKQYDAVVVLAGGQRIDGSGLPPQVEVRLDACLDLMRSQGGGCSVLCTGGGTPHKAPIMRGEYVYHESTACADYLIQRGLPPSRILKEVSSFDTIGNGYFSATIHALPRRWKTIAVITSEFHMPRSKAIFDHCYGLAENCFKGSGISFDLTYIAVSDDCIPADILEARVQREAASLEGFRRTIQRTPTLPEFSEWMHSEHLCYAVPRQSEFGVRTIVDDKALDSY